MAATSGMNAVKQEELKDFRFLGGDSGGDGRLLTEALGSGSRVFKRY